MKAQNKISLKKNKEKVGKTYKVLVDGPSAETDLLLSGRAYFQAPEIDGVVYINDGTPATGEFADVLITEAHPYDLVGTADIGEEKAAPRKQKKKDDIQALARDPISPGGPLSFVAQRAVAPDDWVNIGEVAYRM